MFFATYVLTQKGPLAKVWLAAHWDKKLTSKDVKVIDLKETIVHVVQPTVPIALRTSGELMLGIVRIYALKVAHLLKDATEATQVLLKPRAIHLVKVPGKDGASANTKGGAGESSNAVAITMDVTVGRIGAEQLCDADFGDVADLLNDKGQGKKKDGAATGDQQQNNKAGGGDWWFATEASQTVEEIQYTSRHDAEMARFRAELDKSSASGSKKGSSSTGTDKSQEQNRAANAAAELDIGFVPPNAEEEQEFLLGAGAPLNLDAVLDAAGAMPQHPEEDVTPAPGARQADGQQQPAGAATAGRTGARKLRMVVVMDAETSLKPEQLKKISENRGDIVHGERRHGPLDDTEAQDRTVLRDEAIVSDCSPLACYFNNDILRAAFHTAVNAVAAERISEMERLRGRAGFTGGAAGRPSLVVQDEQGRGSNNQQPQQAAQFDEEMPAMPEMSEQQQQAPRAGQRRSRHEGGDEAEANENDGFSASTLAVLQQLREKLLAAGAKSTSLMSMIEGKSHQAACRTFVDLLHLASHQFVAVGQKEPFGAITVTRGLKFASAKA